MFDRPLFADDMGIPIDIDAEAKVSYKLCGYRVKSGIFGRTAKFGQRPCLFHISNIGIKNILTKQTVKILMRWLIRNRLIWIYTVRKCVCEFTYIRIYPTLPFLKYFLFITLSPQVATFAVCCW